MTGTSKGSSLPTHLSRSSPEEYAPVKGVWWLDSKHTRCMPGLDRTGKWEPVRPTTGDKLFTSRLCQGSTYGMQAMRCGSLAVKSHQRRLLGLSSGKLSLSTRRWAVGSLRVTGRRTLPYMDPWVGKRFTLMCLFLGISAGVLLWVDGYCF